MKVDWKDVENLRKIVLKSSTQAQVLQNLGLCSTGGNHTTLKKYISLYDIDIAHFDKCYEKISNLSKSKIIPLDEILVGIHPQYGSSKLRVRLILELNKKL